MRSDRVETEAAAFEASWRHLDEAISDRDDLAACWSSFCDAECVDNVIVLDDDNHGHIDVVADWPAALLTLANKVAMRFATHIVAALNEALIDAAQHVSGLVEAPDPRIYQMPLCKSTSELAAHLAVGGLRGLRPDQVDVVAQFQPYPVAESEKGASRLIRILMCHLARMVAPDRLVDRPRVAVWARTATPEIRVSGVEAPLECESTGDGLLERVRTVGVFKLSESNPGNLWGNPNIAFDMIFNDEPYPEGPDDNLMARSSGLILITREFILAMERSVGGRELLRSRSTSMRSPKSTGRSLWGPVDLEVVPQKAEIEEALAGSDLGLAIHYDVDGNIAMLVRLGATIYFRPIPPALPLDTKVDQGTEAESATLTAASMWGLPDFVMRPQVVRKGTGSREIGDGTIICDGRGLSIQVKSRVGESKDPAREILWVQKKMEEGASQARGTVRLLSTEPVDLLNGRGRSVPCNGAEIAWTGIVIIDHPSPPNIKTTLSSRHGLPIVVLLRRDWDFLFEQLRSVSAVVDYLHRVSRLEPQVLGNEAARYYELAHADETASPGARPRWIIELGGVSFNRPILPKAPANSADTAGHAVFRVILEDIASTDINRDEADRLKVLALIDRFSVTDRAELGRLLLTQLAAVNEVPTDSTMWRLRRVIQDDGTLQLAFGVCSQLTEVHREAFRQWTMLRHQELTEINLTRAAPPPRTVAILLTPRKDGARPWDTTMFAIDGALELDPEVVASATAFWSHDDGATR